ARGLRMGEVLRLSARLPNASIGTRPALADDIDDVVEKGPVVVVRRMPLPVPDPRESHHLSVGVELELAVRRVPDADVPDAPVPLQAFEGQLVELHLASDAEHDLQLGGVAGRASFDEAAEAVRLGVVADGDEGFGGTARI